MRVAARGELDRAGERFFGRRIDHRHFTDFARRLASVAGRFDSIARVDRDHGRKHAVDHALGELRLTFAAHLGEGEALASFAKRRLAFHVGTDPRAQIDEARLVLFGGEVDDTHACFDHMRHEGAGAVVGNDHAARIARELDLVLRSEALGIEGAERVTPARSDEQGRVVGRRCERNRLGRCVDHAA